MISLSDIRPYTGSVKYRCNIGGRRIKAFIEEQASNEGIDLDPDFQRGHVWSTESQTRYVEHLLRGGTTARTIIWNCPTYDGTSRPVDTDLPATMAIVDGKQRLTALVAFLDDKVQVFGGHYLSDFDQESQNRILMPTGPLQIEMAIHALQYRHDLLQLYVEMNEGAIAHSPEEISRVRQLHRDALLARSAP